MTYTFSGSEIEPNTLAALLLALSQSKGGSYAVKVTGAIGQLHTIEFSNGIKIECRFSEDGSPLVIEGAVRADTNGPVQDDVYTFKIFNADEEMYSH